MSKHDFSLYIGETWTIDGVVNDANGFPVDMTGGSIEFRLASGTESILKLLSPEDITIAPGTSGEYMIQLDDSDVRQNDFKSGSYFYEVDAMTADGAVSVQNTGKLTLLMSLRKKFP